MVKFSERDIRALIDALVAWERVKPGQVGKRVVFEKYGIRGTIKDTVFTAIIYKLERRVGLVDRILLSWGINIRELDDYSRALLRLIVYEKMFGRGISRLFRSLIKHGPIAVEKLSSSATKADELRMVIEKIKAATYSPTDSIERLEFEFSAPYNFIQKLVSVIGFENAREFFKVVNELNYLTFRVNTLKTSVDEAVELLKREGYSVVRGKLVSSVIRVKGPFDYANSKLFKAGYIVPQDEASALAAILLNPRPGEFVVDLCAAPGGKTTHIGELMKNKGKILAVELYEDRARRLKMMISRCGITIAQVLVMDALDAPEVFGEEVADKVLLDPPCSSSGALIKSPEARWRFSDSVLEKLVSKQRELLLSAIKLVKPGGHLLYTTCSVFKEENEDNVSWLLENYGDCLELVDLTHPNLDPGLISGTLRTWPHKHETSGFFYALFRKAKSCRKDRSVAC